MSKFESAALAPDPLVADQTLRWTARIGIGLLVVLLAAGSMRLLANDAASSCCRNVPLPTCSAK